MYDTIYFTLPSFPGIEISAARRYVVVMAPGHVDTIWTHFGPAVHAPIVPDLPPIVAATQTIGNEIFFAQRDIARVRAEGFEVDDDNDPAPENVPGLFVVPPAVVDGGLFEGQSWGWDGIDRRQTAGGRYDEPSFTQGFTPIGKTYLQLFMHFFPMTWFSAVLLPETNAGVVNTGTTPVTFGELLRFLGIRLLMSTCSG